MGDYRDKGYEFSYLPLKCLSMTSLDPQNGSALEQWKGKIPNRWLDIQCGGPPGRGWGPASEVVWK